MTKLKVSINETIASGTEAVNRICGDHTALDDDKQAEVIEQTERTSALAAEVLVVHDIFNTQLHERSDELPKWVNCFKEFIHYRSVQGGPKKRHAVFIAITLSTLNQFS